MNEKQPTYISSFFLVFLWIFLHKFIVVVVRQHLYKAGEWTEISQHCDVSISFQLVLVFGNINELKNPLIHEQIRVLYPVADIVVASTSGEIIRDQVIDNCVVATAVSFSTTKIRSISKKVCDYSSVFQLGNELFNDLNAANPDLAGIFLVSDGHLVNGSELVDGLNKANVNNLPITGGLAGDSALFSNTLTGLNGMPNEGNVIGVGFYGKHFLIGHEQWGGWDEFGRERIITRSENNVLYEIDGQSALGLYKEYLGVYADKLPGSGLLFPLSILIENKKEKMVRTILGINEDENSMTFAGNMPVGSKVRLMKASFDKLIEGVYNASSVSVAQINNNQPQLCIVISCLGRKLILKERVVEEVEAACAQLGRDVTITGFYSNGEICPIAAGAPCELLNQTVTISSFCEL